jgi:hypothetical protein
MRDEQGVLLLSGVNYKVLWKRGGSAKDEVITRVQQYRVEHKKEIRELYNTIA